MRGSPLVLVAALLSACLPSLARGSHVDPVQQVRNLLSAPAGFREFVYTLQNIEDYIDRVDYEESGQRYLVRVQSDAFFIRRLKPTNPNLNLPTANDMESSKLYWSHQRCP